MNIVQKTNSDGHHINHKAFRQEILEWYGRQKRVLPWRSIAEDNAIDVQQKAYAVWLSEIMLQQTVVKAVKPYFEKFLMTWPTVQDLAGADDDDLMQAWAGLGYYSRARNLLKCARVVVSDYKGFFPDNEAGLIKLPGIGPYTAAAITAIAFNNPATVIDGNVDRIIVRTHGLQLPIRDIKKDIRRLSDPFFLSDGIVDDDQHSHFAQSLMDLGATICIPKSPRCMLCPVNGHCLAFSLGNAADLPVKPVKKDKPHKFGDVYIFRNDRNHILIEKREDKGVLASTFGFPTNDWTEQEREQELPVYVKIGQGEELNYLGQVRHVFTHFSLSLAIKEVKISSDIQLPSNMQWVTLEELQNIGMPSLFAKVRKFVIM
jgi:A/G-specific adenine glycosylase